MSILTGKLISKPIIVTIRGNVSSGKSPWAKKIHEAAEAAGYQSEISDYRCFSFSKTLTKDYQREVDMMKRNNVDIGIIVIGTGNDRTPFSIEISADGLTAPMDVLGLLLGWVSQRQAVRKDAA